MAADAAGEGAGAGDDRGDLSAAGAFGGAIFRGGLEAPGLLAAAERGGGALAGGAMFMLP